MTLKPFYNEEAVTVDGEAYRLVINFGAIDAIESITGRSFNVILEELAAEDQKLGLVGKVLWGLLREHHADLTLDHAASLMFGETGITFGLAVHKLLEAAFPPAQEAKVKNPRKRRGA